MTAVQWAERHRCASASAITPCSLAAEYEPGVDQHGSVPPFARAVIRNVLIAYQEVRGATGRSPHTSREASVTADAVANAEQGAGDRNEPLQRALGELPRCRLRANALLANQRTATQIGGQRMVATVVLIKGLRRRLARGTGSAGPNPIRFACSTSYALTRQGSTNERNVPSSRHLLQRASKRRAFLLDDTCARAGNRSPPSLSGDFDQHSAKQRTILILNLGARHALDHDLSYILGTPVCWRMLDIAASIM